MNDSLLIFVEGQDATGKDTQAKLLKQYFEAKGREVVHYSESGTESTDPFVQGIASLNYKTDFGIDKKTRVLLYLVNRYEQWKRFAEPALKSGKVVIITRSWFSTLIYEGYGTGVSKSFIARLHREIMPKNYFTPDKFVIFTLKDEDRKVRLIAQGKRNQEFFKSKDAEFQKRLNDAYLKVAKEYHVPTLDASGTPEEVFEKLKKLFQI
ncbi:dTMP kinase [Candidatus Saccharibacteria bacterium]|nr:dTMP kinase [Candidatus Saccharibacteria bacterium]